MRDIDLSAIRARLAGQKGPAFWRSLEEVAETPEFQAMLHREFPEGASEFTDPAGRRDFLRLMGASIALAGAAACTRQPTEQIVPYVKAPEDLIPGKPLFFATAMPFAGTAVPVLVESHMGRPTKIEPNPEHPVHARRHRPLRPGVDPRSLRSGPLADRDGQGRDSPLERAVAGAHERRGGPEGCRRRRAADPVRRGHVPDAGGADRSACSRPRRRPSGSSTRRSAATTRAPAPGRRSASTSSRSTASTRPT